LASIAIVRTNSVLVDPRLIKIVRSLGKRYSLLVLGWNREGSKFDELNPLNFPSKTEKAHDLIFKIFKLKAPIGKSSLISYLPLIIYFPIFWAWVFAKLIIHRPQVVHACDVDTVLPCYFYKLIFRKKIIFEVFDRYAMTFISSKQGWLHSIINFFEDLFTRNNDYFITVGEKLLRSFRRRPKNYAIIMNCPEDFTSRSSRSQESSHTRDNLLTLVYTGGMKRGRYLENIVAAIKNLDNVELVTAGPIVDKSFFDQIVAVSNVKYKGLLNPDDAIILETKADAMIGLYDLEIPENKFALPNKLFEAMMCGIPIITNVAREVVEETNCGIAINYTNTDSIKSAVLSLRDDIDFRKSLGNNGRNAYVRKYNWTKMEDKLYEIYDSLLKH
jgi:glycosyltransferase involved in cell wall biosynthesis